MLDFFFKKTASLDAKLFIYAMIIPLIALIGSLIASGFIILQTKAMTNPDNVLSEAWLPSIALVALGIIVAILSGFLMILISIAFHLHRDKQTGGDSKINFFEQAVHHSLASIGVTIGLVHVLFFVLAFFIVGDLSAFSGRNASFLSILSTLSFCSTLLPAVVFTPVSLVDREQTWRKIPARILFFCTWRTIGNIPISLYADDYTAKKIMTAWLDKRGWSSDVGSALWDRYPGTCFDMLKLSSKI